MSSDVGVEISPLGGNSGYQTLPLPDNAAEDVRRSNEGDSAEAANKFSIFDVISTWQVFILLTLPLFAGFLAAIVPNYAKYDTYRLPIRLNAPEVLNASSSADGGRRSLIAHHFHNTLDGYYELRTDINILSYVRSFVQMPLTNVSRDLCHQSNSAPAPLVGTIGMQTKLVGHESLTSADMASWRPLTNDSIDLLDFNLHSRNCSLILSPSFASQRLDLMVPLQLQSFDAPHVLTSSPQRMVVRFSLSNVRSDMATTPEYVVVTHNANYNALLSIVCLAFGGFSSLYLLYAKFAVARHILHNRPSAFRWSDSPSWLDRLNLVWSTTLLILYETTVEQYISLLLLGCLSFWQNPLRHLYVLLHYWGGPRASDATLMMSGMTSSLSAFGLQFLLAVYIRSLKYNRSREPVQRQSSSDAVVSTNPWVSPVRGRHASSSSSSAQYSSQFWLYSSSQQWTDRYRAEYDRVAAAESERRQSREEQRDALWNYALRKGLLLALTWLLVAVYWLMKFPALCRRMFTIANSSVDDSEAYRLWYSLVEFALIGLQSLWTLTLLKSLYSTLVRLKKSNYMSNRFHQIAYILIVAQINLGLLLFAVCVVWNISVMGVVSSGSLLFGKFDVLGWLVYAVRWANYVGGLHGLVSAAPLSPPSMPLFLFTSFLVYTVVYITLPVSINLTAQDKDDMTSLVGSNRCYYINLERQDHLREGAFTGLVQAPSVKERREAHQRMRKLLIEQKYAQFLRRYVEWKAVRRRSRVFCVETACQLLEASYQSYFPIKKVVANSLLATPSLSRRNSGQPVHLSPGVIDLRTPSSVPGTPLEGSGPWLDLSRLELRLQDTFQDEGLSTFGYLAHHYAPPLGDHAETLSKVVVAFRGSTAANIAIDFKFALMPLPELRHSRAHFVNILRHLDARGKDAVEEPLPYTDLSPAKSPAAVRTSTSHAEFSDLLDSLEAGEGSAEGGSGTATPRVRGGYYQLSTAAEESPTRVALDDAPSETVLNRIKSVGSSIPLVKEALPRVHVGFWQAYASVREQFLVSAVRAIAQHRRQHLGGRGDVHSEDDLALDVSEIQPLRMDFTGHSLGGTMATLAAVDLAANMGPILEALCYVDYLKPTTITTTAAAAAAATMTTPAPLGEDSSEQTLRTGLSRVSRLRTWLVPELAVYTYGCPRIGNFAFRQMAQRSVSTNYRVALNGDLVPMVPKFPGYYYHCGVNVVLDEEDKGSLLVKPSLVEQWLLRNATGNLLNHSLDKYRDCLEACFERSQLEEYLSRELLLHQAEAGSVTAEETAGSSGSNLSSAWVGVGSGGKRRSLGRADLPDWLIDR